MATADKNGASIQPLIIEAERTVRECIKHFGLKCKPEQEKIAFRRDVFSRHRNRHVAPTKSGGTRMLKCECPKCGYVARITQKWIDTGLPTCPCGEEMGTA